jgi:hypothetical protein
VALADAPAKMISSLPLRMVVALAVPSSLRNPPLRIVVLLATPPRKMYA